MRRSTLLCLLLPLACATPGPAIPPPPEHDAVAFVGVTVIPLDTERTLPGQTVVVEGGTIVAVGPATSTAIPEGALRVEGHGRFLLPALADMHVHLNHEEDLALYVAKGVATVRNLWGAPIHLRWRERIARGELVGPTIYTAGPILDGEDPAHDGSLVLTRPEEVEAALQLHRAAGYDFVKVYNGLSLPVYERIVAAARAAGLPVAGHVPLAVGLPRAIDSGQLSVEHFHGFVQALQADGSPYAGRSDEEARRKGIDHVDVGKIPALVAKLKERGVRVCPTRTLMHAWEPAANVREWLGRPELEYVPAATRATWEPGPDDAGELERSRKLVALFDRLVVALRDGGASVVVGTDTGNPLVVPGFTVHEELRQLVHAGFTPFQALRAATVEAARLLGVSGKLGVVAVGARGELLLLDANPLEDVARTERIAGVLVRGRWRERPELDALLAGGAATIDGRKEPFRGQPELEPEGPVLLAATYEITWAGTSFGTERLVVEKFVSGNVIRAQSFDPHAGQWTSLRLDGARLRLSSDGPTGSGWLEVERVGAEAKLGGVLLSGVPFTASKPLPEAALLSGAGFVAGTFLLAERLSQLAPGETLELDEREVSLGSTARLSGHRTKATRLPDEVRGPGTARRFQLQKERGGPAFLTLDALGFPLRLESRDHGAELKITRVE